MKMLAAAVAAATLLSSCGGRALAETTSSEAIVLVNAESVELLCPADAACKLEMGTAFGDPWVKAEAGDVGYFEVSPSTAPDIPPRPVPRLARCEELVSMPNMCGAQQPPMELDQATYREYYARITAVGLCFVVGIWYAKNRSTATPSAGRTWVYIGKG